MQKLALLCAGIFSSGSMMVLWWDWDKEHHHSSCCLLSLSWLFHVDIEVGSLVTNSRLSNAGKLLAGEQGCLIWDSNLSLFPLFPKVMSIVPTTIGMFSAGLHDSLLILILELHSTSLGMKSMPPHYLCNRLWVSPRRIKCDGWLAALGRVVLGCLNDQAITAWFTSTRGVYHQLCIANWTFLQD